MQGVRFPSPLVGRRRRTPPLPLRLAQETLAGIANENYVQVQTLTWETQSDWDAASSESDVLHEAAVVSIDLAFFKDDFEGSSLDTSSSGWNDTSNASGGTNTIVSSPVYEGSSALEKEKDAISDNFTTVKDNFAPNKVLFEIWFYDDDSTFENRHIIQAQNGGSDLNLFGVWPNDFPNHYIWRQDNDFFSTGVDRVNGWVKFGARVNDNGSQFEVNGQVAEDFPSGETTCNKFGFGTFWGSTDRAYWDHARAYDLTGTSGSLTTATKTAAVPIKPNLDSLVYTLNGQAITLDVIGSPGTASEETVSQTLDGASSYNLSWANSHQDFRIGINLISNDGETTPSVDSLSLTT